MITSEKIPVARLNEIFRQEKASRIVINAHTVNQGRIPSLKTPERLSDFYFIKSEDPEEALQLLLRLVKERIPSRFGCDPIRDIQVIAPMTRGTLGTRNLNHFLQNELNPRTDGERVERFGWLFALGDKVIQTANDYQKDIFNGDIGIVKSIDHELKKALIDFDGRPVTYLFDELDDIVPAYAITIHKSQGCEFPARSKTLPTRPYRRSRCW